LPKVAADDKQARETATKQDDVIDTREVDTVPASDEHDSTKFTSLLPHKPTALPPTTGEGHLRALMAVMLS